MSHSTEPIYTARRASHARFLSVRGLRYHLRVWEPDPARPCAGDLFMLHGWMDVSASFQFLVDALAGNWRVFAPDWRGYGLTDCPHADTYWFPDYLADLDALRSEQDGHDMASGARAALDAVRRFPVPVIAALRAATKAPISIDTMKPAVAMAALQAGASLWDDVAHSMGGNVSMLYAGVRPHRVRRLVNLEGVGMRGSPADRAPQRYAQWLDELAAGARMRDYGSLDEVAQRLM